MANTDQLPPRRQRALANDEQLPDTPIDGILPESESTEMARFEEEEKIRSIIVNEENQGAKLEIYRKAATGRWDYLTMLPIEEWNAEARHNLAKEYGGGEYKARVRRAGGTLHHAFQFSVDKSVRPAAIPGEGTRPSELVELMKLKSGDAGMLPLLFQMMQAQQAQMMAQQQQTTQLLVAAFSRPTPAGPSDTLLQFALTKASQPAPALDLDKLIGIFARLKEISGGGRGNGGGGGRGETSAPRDDGFWTALLSQLPNLLAAIGQAGLMAGASGPAPAASQVTNGTPPIPPLAPPSSSLAVAVPLAPPVTVNSPGEPLPAAAVPPAAPPSPEAARTEANKKALAALAENCVKQAMAGTDPALCAGELSSALDDDNFTALAVVLQREDWFALLCDVHEPAMMHVIWFRAWRDAMLAELEPGQ